MELIAVIKETLKQVQGDVTVQKEYFIRFVLAELLVRVSVRMKMRALSHHLPNNRARMTMRMRGLNYHLPNNRVRMKMRMRGLN